MLEARDRDDKMKHGKQYRRMLLTGQINGPLLMLLFCVMFANALLGRYAIWQSIVFGLLSATLVVICYRWPARSWRERV